ncbi:class I SAM-dependent methyltransferase [Streptomyces sp. NBC_00474]|uniref:class I SAM-dependent methyltransferase n=1 Tax=Streptomyces sp. NBC_00474 TaxID=2975754 RepID=UPI0022511002|nr:class I SAM-dependent methyltransferase [Streptomyces sp. NBC_00474]MCX5055072.1 class I SAM-dependent methyltransferase [Streptomyces sp. NBC_00474]
MPQEPAGEQPAHQGGRSAPEDKRSAPKDNPSTLDGARPAAEGARAWSGPEGAQAFAAVDAATDWLVGYPFVFRALAEPGRTGRVLLDFGCGPGAVAEHAARLLGMRIIGVDASPEMLALARERGTPGAEYHLVTGGRAEGLSDACADAAMCNHVLASLPDERTVLAVFSEIHRLLRPGAPLVLLTTDPACSGIEYASLRVGVPGVRYGPGRPMTVRLRRTDGTWQTMPNHAWPPAAISALLERAGFTRVVQHHPTPDEAEGVADPAHAHSRDWTAERRRPPLVVTVALKG